MKTFSDINKYYFCLNALWRKCTACGVVHLVKNIIYCWDRKYNFYYKFTYKYYRTRSFNIDKLFFFTIYTHVTIINRGE